MYGIYNKPFELEKELFKLGVKREDNRLYYFRQKEDDIIEKDLLTKKFDLHVSPVEPLNIPKEITDTLLIELENPSLIGPKTTKKAYLTFPLEIGAFLICESENERLDLFSLSKPKYTLYGDITDGKICKYWSSKIYNSIPEVDYLKEGIIKLKLKNVSNEWIALHNIVFDAYGMKLYYDDEMVGMEARMVIRDEGLSETYFKNKPIKEGMKKGVEVFTKALQPLKGTKFIMEGGV